MTQVPSPASLRAEPSPIDIVWSKTALVIIDMQRDFLEPGGFGETLGNDVSLLQSAVGPCLAVLRADFAPLMSPALIAPMTPANPPAAERLA